MQRSIFAAALACAFLWGVIADAQTVILPHQLAAPSAAQGTDTYVCDQYQSGWKTVGCTNSGISTWLQGQSLDFTGTVGLPSSTTVNGDTIATEPWTASNYLSNSEAGTINLSGSAAPTAATGTVLDLVQSSGTASRVQSTAYAASGAFTGARYDGTPGSPAAVQSGETIGTIDAYPYNGSALVGSVASLRFYAAENIASGHQGSQACVATTPIGSTTLANSLCQGNDGGVTVGSATDEGAGTINGALYSNGTALGSMATQAAGSVAITGGSIGGVTFGVNSFGASTFTNGDLLLLGSSTGKTAFSSANATSSNYTITVPAVTDTMVLLAATQTLTGKSIAASEVNSGTLSPAQIPLATTSAAGGVQVGSGLSVSGGVVSCPAATTSALGCMEVGSGLSVSGGVVSCPAATTSALGCMEVGSGLSVSGGVVSCPAATTSALGCMEVGSGLSVSGGVVSSSVCTPASTQGSTSGYNPTAPASTTAYEAQGLGANLSITPACTGTVLFVVSGTIKVSATTAGLGVIYYLYYGSGTAPANGGSLSGPTLCSPAQTYTNPTTVTSADVAVPFSIQCVVSGLTVGTAYWADLGAEALTTASDTKFTNVNVSAVEN